MLGWQAGGRIIRSYKYEQREWDRKGEILSSLKAS